MIKKILALTLILVSINSISVYGLLNTCVPLPFQDKLDKVEQIFYETTYSGQVEDEEIIENVYLDIPLEHEIQDIIYNEVVDKSIPFELVVAVFGQETGGTFKYDMISPTNDWGAMQINEINHQWFRNIFGDIDFLNPTDNIRCGVYLLNILYEKYNDYNLTLMAYNMGENGASKYWDVGIYKSDYSKGVLERYEAYVRATEDSRRKPQVNIRICTQTSPKLR